MIKVGVIGYGYWGPNVARNFSHPGISQVVAITDKRPECLKRAQQNHPGTRVTDDANEVLTSPDIDVVAVVTPVWTHYELAKAALENGKHVFVEKPFTANVAQAEELIELARKQKSADHGGPHLPIHRRGEARSASSWTKARWAICIYYDSMRVNLGLFQHDINVIWDLAPHDLSIMDYVIEKKPEAIVATGEKHLNGHVDVAFITIYFPAQRARAHQRQLAFAGKGAHHA